MPIPYLPPEILDHIIDLIHCDRETLKKCCIVSKSWVPRTRRHLFAEVKFRSVDDFELWKRVFPDVATSPACHTRTLSIDCPGIGVEADVGEGSWTQAFSSVESLRVNNGARPLDTSRCPLTPFHGFSSTLKSFSVDPIILPSPQRFYLIHSSPLLENLTVVGRDESSGNDNNPHWLPLDVPLISPPLGGSIDLSILGGIGNTARRLLDLPNGLHFRNLSFSWDRKEDLGWITELVRGCSHALENLYLSRKPRGVSV